MDISTFPQLVNWFFTTGNPAPDISIWLFILIVAWSLGWKGAALWKAARNNQSYWFTALMLINTVGVLEILYIYVFSQKKPAGGSIN